ncbi:hypothetical protein H6P81_004849 [Aristolochia fimbriata]|uniref:Uncharacterized protein n=1 Tax=Aristolochia fimbriata TaxID=158543 RepID=A0AAV7EV35_ARIFI|nr:hypothetical protein H6P81_004849 [Aristolochia fimbriata]
MGNEQLQYAQGPPGNWTSPPPPPNTGGEENKTQEEKLDKETEKDQPLDLVIERWVGRCEGAGGRDSRMQKERVASESYRGKASAVPALKKAMTDSSEADARGRKQNEGERERERDTSLYKAAGLLRQLSSHGLSPSRIFTGQPNILSVPHTPNPRPTK